MTVMTSAAQLLSAHRIVVKIGSALIADGETGHIRGPWLETMIEDVVRFFARGQQVIIVTSGAVAAGSYHFNDSDSPLKNEERKAAAAIGQVRLMLAFERSLKRFGFGLGQLLLTGEDLRNRHRRINMWSTVRRILQVGALPVINENDTTATTETCVGDNDQLAAHVAELLQADILILLSNIDGLFTEDPHNNPSARLITKVQRITPRIEAMATHSHSRHSSGGMLTKLMAARITMNAGCNMIIAKGTRSYPLSAIENGGPSTWFVPSTSDRADCDICADNVSQA
ncbi:glutamate 5-kinase (plasmid) [Rhizobium sp. CB3090]|uniref:glutamate 5-kinase n=1 Tax=Rhizobium sp. CB3090 TaxID=3039156 RepID=UPI0024B096E0|nr:glutamate 5-kinase [Rhizobium sp. CB3090]WFU12796.1 glutamate 5-kinase [Rhizobium sp. CB3090]